MSQYDLQAKCARVNKSKPTRPAFEPLTAKELIDVFTRGVAVRTSCIANRLHKRVDEAEERSSTSSSGKGSRRKRKSRHSQERIAQADSSQSRGDQRPEEKKAKVERPPSSETL